ncbi:MAG: thioredoxin-disulfide reductase [Elusimicrobia bacterium]|nr:thioredoxin-disulfide reductase [Elusimicrobiota bacterium]
MERCLVIGSGCAGLTAGIYAARSGLDPLIISGLLPGGQLTMTTEVENFPGFPSPVQGQQLMDAMRKQGERLGVRFVNDLAEEVNFKKHPFSVRLAGGSEIAAQAVIVATGAAARWLGLGSEQRLRGKGVSACATCDGFFFKGKDVLVIGGGDTALEEACFLTKFASSVAVVHRRGKFRATSALVEKAGQNKKIRFIFDCVAEEVLGRETVEGVRLKNVASGAVQSVKCEGLFVAIGHEPATSFLKGQLALDEQGYILVKPAGFVVTDTPGVFAAGDCADHRYRQAVTASAFGSMAAIEAGKWLENKGFV